MKHMRAKIAALLLAAMCLSSAACAEVFFEKMPQAWEGKPLLRWTIFNVNQADAMLLECGEESMLVDGGPDRYGERLRDVLDARGLRSSMKYVLNTHFHDDHIGGITRLFRDGFMPGEFLQPYGDITISRNERMTNTIRVAKKKGIPIRRVGDGDMLTLGDAQIQILRCLGMPSENANSLVLKVTFGDSSILLCADITPKVQEYFQANLPAEVLQADLIKVPHHGINRMNSEFLSTVAPEAVVITSLPHLMPRETTYQLEKAELPAVYSGSGTICAVTDGTDWYIEQTLGAL